MAVCYSCGSELPGREKIFRSTRCSSCGADVRVCLNCEFYAPGVHWECRETISEPVRDKERANFCDFFKPSAGSNVPHADNNAGQARNDFQQLFGND